MPPGTGPHALGSGFARAVPHILPGLLGLMAPVPPAAPATSVVPARARILGTVMLRDLSLGTRYPHATQYYQTLPAAIAVLIAHSPSAITPCSPLLPPTASHARWLTTASPANGTLGHLAATTPPLVAWPFIALAASLLCVVMDLPAYRFLPATATIRLRTISRRSATMLGYPAHRFCTVLALRAALAMPPSAPATTGPLAFRSARPLLSASVWLLDMLLIPLLPATRCRLAAASGGTML